MTRVFDFISEIRRGRVARFYIGSICSIVVSSCNREMSRRTRIVERRTGVIQRRTGVVQRRTGVVQRCTGDTRARTCVCRTRGNERWSCTGSRMRGTGVGERR
jgi:hypothetical protein